MSQSSRCIRHAVLRSTTVIVGTWEERLGACGKPNHMFQVLLYRAHTFRGNAFVTDIRLLRRTQSCHRDELFHWQAFN